MFQIRRASKLTTLTALWAIIATPALSDDTNSAEPFVDSLFFAAVEAGAVFRSGSTSTTTGGAAFGLGGISRNVDFGTAYSVGVRLGYLATPKLSFFLSYDHVDGDLGFRADFPGIAATDQRYIGRGTSEVILANVGYSMEIDAASRFNFSAGAGVSFNQFHNIVETGSPPSTFFAPVEDGNTTSFAGRLSAGYERDFSENLSFTVNAGLNYYGDFETGESRNNNGIGPIIPIGKYEIDNVWGGSISGALKLRF